MLHRSRGDDIESTPPRPPNILARVCLPFPDVLTNGVLFASSGQCRAAATWCIYCSIELLDSMGVETKTQAGRHSRRMPLTHQKVSPIRRRGLYSSELGRINVGCD